MGLVSSSFHLVLCIGVLPPRRKPNRGTDKFVQSEINSEKYADMPAIIPAHVHGNELGCTIKDQQNDEKNVNMPILIPGCVD